MSSRSTLPLICVPRTEGAITGLSIDHAAWARANGFCGQAGRLLALPGAGGRVAGYLFGTGLAEKRSPLITGLAGAALEPGAYRLEGDFDSPRLAALGFGLGAYRFARYTHRPAAPTLETPAGVDAGEVTRLTEAAYLARDLINTPANDMGPVAFEREIRALADRHQMAVKVTVGDDLLTRNFPLIHAVGRAGPEAPRLVELVWGRPGDPKVTLVGKGVTFDTGGLDIKSPTGMALMKKDMGGAANIMGLAHAIMAAKLRLRLKVLIPIVENSISATAFRPGDVIASRNGMNVEIGNTDAEGRLILADALALADEESPHLIIDMATLTGAARIALGPELPPLYATEDADARDLMASGLAWGDPLWQLPLWAPYDVMLASKIADVNHIAAGTFAGSIIAALFLKRFVAKAGAWVHLDIYGWAPEARAGRPQGGTDQGIRAVYGVLKKRFG